MNLHAVLQSRFVRFLAVGGLNTLFGYGVYAVMIASGAHYALASGVALVLGVLFNFKTTGVLVFRSGDNSRIVHFVGVYAVAYGFNVGGIAVLQQCGLNDYAAGLVVLLPQAVLTYYLCQRFVFTTGKAS
ncbi:MAG: GtrA family protein [Rhodospirillales bacterium]|nr:GtrA family protein [Alphaproteobacteria bacterium]MCB9987193.1 GtrA family protein [Rhodospirillales bacterium]USO07945.1 MAG: GtrA family protein [Rhodospirillales bacterium]